MPRLKRRQCLQFAASALSTLGLSQLDIQRQGLGYAKSLAQSTTRKLALLVGINAYSAPNQLRGCVTDVDLQRELLIHRFGFNPSDVHLITDETDVKPTRVGILQAFEEHLIKQAKLGDIVVFHFSGHGSQVYDPDSGFPDQLNSTFVPINREISQRSERTVVSDIMGKTLFLLMSNLKTENVTVILDSCHSGGGKRGNLTIRASDGGRGIEPSSMEREYQQQLMSRLGVTREQVKKLRQESIAKGVVIASAARDQLAADTPFDGFHAGAFTYALTQYLWQATGNEGVSRVVANVSRSTTQISSTRQVPEFEVKKGTDNDRKPTYFLNKQAPPAEAVITKIDGDRVEFWLGGIEPRSIAAFNKGAVFLLLDEQGQKVGVVQLESRDPKNGLIGRGKLLEIRQPNNLKPGLLLQEQARAIPENLALRIGLDESLAIGGSRVSLEAFPKIGRLEPTPLGATEVHYILGRMTEARVQELQKRKQQEIPAITSVGLYDQGLELIPGSFGDAGESVTQAVERLKAKFRSLLAARLVKLTLNADSSRMNVSAKMKIVDGQTGKPLDVVAQEFTVRGGNTLGKTEGENQSPVVIPGGAVTFENGIPRLPLGTRVQLEVENREKGDLYVTVLVISPEGDMFVKAIEYYQQRLAIAREIGDRDGEGKSLGYLGLAYYSLEDYSQAIKYQQQSLAIAREIHHRQGEANSLGNLGNAYFSLGDYSQAIEYQQQRLAIAREIQDRLSEGNALGDLGAAYQFLGDYSKAIEYQQQSLAIAREIQDRRGEGTSLGNLGLAYDSLGDYAKAIEYQQQRLAIAQEIHDRRGEGQSLGNLGLAYLYLGDYAKAIEYQQQSLAIDREIHNLLGEGASLGNLGLAYYALGDYSQAIEYQQQRLAIAREIKDRLGEGQSLGNLGLAYSALGDYTKAIDYYQQQLAITQEIGDRDGEGKSLNNLGNALRQSGNLTQAEKRSVSEVAAALKYPLSLD